MKRDQKRWLSGLLCLVMALSILPVTAQADTLIDSGSCGEDLTWELSEDGTLVVSGTGAMDSYRGSRPWSDCGDLITAVVIEPGVTSIGDYAFFDCVYLTTVTLPEGLTSIGTHAFYYCIRLTHVVIPKSVTSIGAQAFAICYDLGGIHVDPLNEHYTNDSAGVLFDKDMTTLIQAPGNISGTYTVPVGVEHIGAFAFSQCYHLVRVKLPKGLISIGDSAFSECDYLSEIEIPRELTTIGMYVFYPCYSLYSVIYYGTKAQWNTIKKGSQDEQLAKATIHYLGENITVVSPTCTEPGYTVYACSDCSITRQENPVSALGHSYSGGSCTVCGGADPDWIVDPGLALSYPSLSFEDEIFYNVYYTVEDMTSVVEMGLMLLPSAMSDGTMDDAIGTVPGYVTNGTAYLARTEGIPAVNMGDTVYFKVYAKLTDGSYAYSDVGGYDAAAYADTVLSGDYPAAMRSLVVAMVEYGAQAQTFFGHDTDDLVNSALTGEQKALVSGYDETMVAPVVSADSAKTGSFVRVNSNFRELYPSVSFDGAFSVNYYCTPAITVDNGMQLYWWDSDTYESIDQFTLDNATGSMEMTVTNGQYWGCVAGIAAKDMDKTCYVSCVFESEGETVTTGIISYSLGKYCEGKAAVDGDPQQSFAQATVVYGYYAKRYFSGIA